MVNYRPYTPYKVAGLPSISHIRLPKKERLSTRPRWLGVSHGSQQQSILLGHHTGAGRATRMNLKNPELSVAGGSYRVPMEFLWGSCLGLAQSAQRLESQLLNLPQLLDDGSPAMVKLGAVY